MNIDQWAETCHATSTVKECLSELVCGFFKNTAGSSNYKILNDAMKNKQEKMWKEVAVAYFKNMPRILLEENHKQTIQYNKLLG